uniref:(northern house mosquito) hypothetical protein n=1 Tax=Culex pipiens TaxID=7175 RepID=A0A8D8MDZ7_CULPI
MWTAWWAERPANLVVGAVLEDLLLVLFVTKQCKQLVQSIPSSDKVGPIVRPDLGDRSSARGEPMQSLQKAFRGEVRHEFEVHSLGAQAHVRLDRRAPRSWANEHWAKVINASFRERTRNRDAYRWQIAHELSHRRRFGLEACFALMHDRACHAPSSQRPESKPNCSQQQLWSSVQQPEMIVFQNQPCEVMARRQNSRVLGVLGLVRVFQPPTHTNNVVLV